jgi:hypothetical protein
MSGHFRAVVPHDLSVAREVRRCFDTGYSASAGTDEGSAMTQVDQTGEKAITAARRTEPLRAASSTRQAAAWGCGGFGRTGRSGTRAGGVWKDRPRHDDASHGADAFLTFACSNYQPPSASVPKKRDMRWIV